MTMQLRTGAVTGAEETDHFLRETTRPQTAPKREWPAKLAKIFFIFVLLGAGIMLGAAFALHISRYLAPGSFFSNSISLCTTQAVPSASQVKLKKWFKPEDWLRGPLLQHNMSDSELLWLASLAPRRHGLPIRRTPKVAFMFLTRGPLPLGPLWERFFQGHEGLYTVYVHAHPGYNLQVSSSSAFYKRQIQSKEARWGDITMCDAERRLLANALLDFSNERFILLSESCIPLYSFPTVYNHLIFSKNSFVSVFDDPGPYGRGRYNVNMEPLVTSQQWRKGSQWFEVNRNLANYIVSDVQYYEKFKEFCKPSCYVDEHYIPTMLSIQFGPEVANRSVTWVDWSRGGPHPGMFSKNDITEDFLRRIREHRNCPYNGHSSAICFLFARKFSPNTLDPLLKLSPKILDL